MEYNSLALDSTGRKGVARSVLYSVRCVEYQILLFSDMQVQEGSNGRQTRLPARLNYFWI